MRRLVLALFAALILLGAALPPASARAEGVATLVADAVRIAGGDTLVAEGNVEVFLDGRRLRASRVAYDKTSDTLTIEGPILLTDADGTVVSADAASLSGDLREGILTSARLVLDQQLQLAANEIARIGGRYTRLSKTVASSCQVCASRPVPLWEIRAAQIIHDQQERQLYFDQAQFRVMGVPVFYLPHLRMPDPTLKRATGFLMPTVRTTSVLGTGIKLPYFIRLGDHADLTLTPYLSSSRTTTVEARYRQAFRNGEIEFNGAVSQDDLVPGSNRGYLFAEGRFDLPRDFKLSFGIEAVSDPSYLTDYSLSDKDRLVSGVEITRTRRNEYIRGRVLNYHSIRAGEKNSTLPTLIGDLTYHRRFQPPVIGGEGGFRFQTHSHRRSSTLDFDSADSDTVTDGRDVLRASARLDWRRNWLLSPGIVLSTLGEVNADIYAISQDAAYPGTVTRLTPIAAVELRWPWLRTQSNGVSHVIEPVVQLVYSPRGGNAVPNEDSALVEFDEGNLFSLTRFPGADRVERGPRANVGVSWTRYDPNGWSMGVTVGRILRSEDFGQFTPGSGLSGVRSDWLAAVQLSFAEGLTLTNRAIFDDDFSVAKNELRMDWTTQKFGLSTSYIWMEADPVASQPGDTSEWTMDAAYQITDNWAGKLAWRYDFVTDKAASAGLGLQYRNECVKLDLSLSRRFTSSTSVRPTTDFGLTVDLVGFGNSGDGRRYRRGCAG